MKRMMISMKTALIMTVSLIPFVCASSDAANDADLISWHDAKTQTVEGRGWSDTAEFYNRLPAKAQGKVPKSVWGLSKDSAGMVVRFVTDSPEIHARWKLISDSLGMPHMPATGVSGVDLYVRLDGKWLPLAVGRPSGLENESKLIAGLPSGEREYALYLPLYNGVISVEIGIAKTATIKPGPPRTLNIRPVVIYGSSITQGGCASRPGMAYPAIIGRRLDCPVINLGFSGSGKCEHEVSDLLAELDPEVYVIDCLPNMVTGDVDERIRYLLTLLRQKHPETPVILVEQAPCQSAFALIDPAAASASKNQVLQKIYKDCAKEWPGKLYYVKGNTLLGGDGEGTVDGVHPTDLGFQRMADALTPVIKKALR